MRTGLLALITTLSVTATPFAVAWAGSPPAALPSKKRTIELDEKALWAKRSAAHALADLIRKNANSSGEPDLLLRLAEMHEDIATIQFRLAYAKAADQKNANLSSYNTSMNSALAPLNRLITRYSNWKDIPRAYYLRAKAYSETSRVNEAIADLKHLVGTWPTSRDAPVANMDLWRLLIMQKDYTTAIQYINRYGLKPSDKYYHAALEKLAWCHYYLGLVPEALRYTETELETVKGLERDKALSNFALFYVTGVERRTPGVDAANSLPRFKRNASGNDLGTLLVSYAFLLRTKGMDSQLDDLKNGALKENIPDAYKSDLILITMENQYNRQHVADLKVSAEQEIELFTHSKTLKKDPRRVAKLKVTFGEIMPGLQKLVVGASEAQTQAITETLRIGYQFMLETSEGNVLEQAKIHFNMAELSLELKEYEPATHHYRWIVDHLSASNKEHQELYELASLKAIDARYAMIKEKGWVPTSLAAKRLSTPPKDVPKPVTEWIDWIDQFPKAVFISKKADVHAFEANRILYSFDQIEKATKRLSAFAEQYPTSASAIPAASLVMDTYIASEAWLDAYELTKKYLAVKEWQGTPFHARLVDLSSDLYCKVLDASYREKKYAETIKNAESFLAENPASKRKGDVLELSANAALAMGDREKASQIFKQLLDSGVKKPEVTTLAHMTSGSIAEDRFDLGEAAKSYRLAAVEAATVNDDLRTKILLWSWLSGDPRQLNETLGSTKICKQGGGKELCSLYVRRFEESYGSVPSNSNGPSSHPIARIAIREQFAAKDRPEILAMVPNAWSKLDAMERSVVLPLLVRRLPEHFQAIRGQVRKSSPLQLNRATISKRTHLIDEAQSLAEKMSNIPSLKIRLALVRESAMLYEDAAQDLLSVPIPAVVKGDALKEVKQALAEGAASFTKKAEELRKSENELASQHGAEIDSEDAQKWVEVFLDRVDSKSGGGKWFEPFKQSLEKENWPLATFLIERSGAAPESLTFLRASLLARSGSSAEALEEIKRFSAATGTEIEAKLGFAPPVAPSAAAVAATTDAPPAPASAPAKVPAPAPAPAPAASSVPSSASAPGIGVRNPANVKRGGSRGKR